jgi:hypothetical protein
MDMNSIYLCYFWIGISALLIISTALILRELKCYFKWKKYKRDINWLGEYLKSISINKGEAAEIIWAATSSIKNVLASNSPELPVQAVLLPEHKKAVENRKADILDMANNFKKNGKRLYLLGLLLLAAMNVFLFYGSSHWDYRVIGTLSDMISDETEGDAEAVPTVAVTEAPVQKAVTYQQIEVKSSKASSILTGRNTGKEYDSTLTLDGDLTTCWQEGTDDDGIGERVSYRFNELHPLVNIKIWNGKLDNKKKYEENNRIKELEIICYKAGTKVYDTTMTLKDEYDEKGSTLTLNGDIAIDTDHVVIKIISVYKGSKYSDTCLSEIEFYEGVYE